MGSNEIYYARPLYETTYIKAKKRLKPTKLQMLRSMLDPAQSNQILLIDILETN